MVLTGIASTLSSLSFWPRQFLSPVIVVLTLGIFVRNTFGLHQSLQKGVAFSLKTLLPLSIVLLGARLQLSELFAVGPAGLLLVAFTILFVFAVFLLLYRVLGSCVRLWALLAIGTAICGGSAILAAAPVVRAEKSQIVFSVATVACVGVFLMFLLPLFGYFVGMNGSDFGMLAGLSIHQTPQVIAAGFAYGDEAGTVRGLFRQEYKGGCD
jgi:uncharacterized integral membrane protein (TIGR00698 family)